MPHGVRPRAWLLAGALVVLTAATACVPDPQRALAVELGERLAAAHADLQRGGDVEPPCDAAGEVRAKLYVEPGPRGGIAARRSLRDATDALLSACGQLRLAAEARGETRVAQAARETWRARASDALRQMCTPLGLAARELDAPTIRGRCD